MVEIQNVGDAHITEDGKPKKRIIWYKCDKCGYVWRSYSTGKRVSCPKCYQEATGKAKGADAEHMAKMREILAEKKAAEGQAVPEQGPLFKDFNTGKTGSPKKQPQELPKQSKLDRLLNIQIGGSR